jgi:hypothetical protein
LQQSDSPKATVVGKKWQETQTILASSLAEAKLVGTGRCRSRSLGRRHSAIPPLQRSRLGWS